jgi:hypothetical protein
LVAVGWISPPAVGVCAGVNCGSLLRLVSSVVEELFADRHDRSVGVEVATRDARTGDHDGALGGGRSINAGRIGRIGNAIDLVLSHGRSGQRDGTGAAGEQQGLKNDRVVQLPHFVLPSQKNAAGDRAGAANRIEIAGMRTTADGRLTG